MSTPTKPSAVPANIYLALGVAATVLYFVVPSDWHNPLFDAVGVSAVAAILVGTIRNRPRDPWPWRLMAIGQLLFVAGDVSWSVYDEVLGEAFPFVSAGDVAYLLAYLPLTAGLLLIVRVRRPGRDVTSLIDAAIVTVAAAAAAWIFVIAPLAMRSGVSEAEIVVSLAYATADVLLIAMAATFVLTEHTSVMSSRLLGLSLLALIVADVLFIPASLNDSYQTGDAIDAGWMLSYVLWGAAALHPSMRELTEPREEGARRFTRKRLLIDSLVVIAIPLMWAIQTVRNAPRYSPVVVAASTIASILVILRMTGLLETLDEAALHDPLTGLPNRRLLLDRIGQAFRRAQRSGSPVVVLFLDMHGLKKVNDRFGHEAGDDALIEMGQRIEASVRSTDTVARLGGDEFVIVCEGLDRVGADKIADRIDNSVRRPLDINGEAVTFSVDIGIAVETAREAMDVSALLRSADRAMYEAKAATPKTGRAP